VYIGFYDSFFHLYTLKSQDSAGVTDLLVEVMKYHTLLGSEMGAVSKAAEAMRHKADELCYHLLSSLQNSQQPKQ